MVEPIGELLGADRVVATRMIVGEDGCFTGEVEYYAYGPTKAEAIRELAGSEGYDLSRCYAYSDSATDLPMLEAVATRTRSTRTGRCAGKPSRASGRFSISIARCGSSSGSVDSPCPRVPPSSRPPR